MTPEEIEDALGTPVMGPRTIAGSAELLSARAEVRGTLEAEFPHIASREEFIVAVCEALANAGKHGGAATYEVRRCENSVHILISNEGPGIDFDKLPRATLAPRFSTQQTLGVGFTLMLDLGDRVLLSTQRGKTMVVLEISK